MPKRTNLFQRTVLLLEHQFGAGVQIEESAMLPDIPEGTEAEVDILVKQEVNGILVKLGIECTARGRPADKVWVRSMVAKHARLETDKLILVSASGFHETARRYAIAEGAETLTLEEAEDIDWLSYLHRYANLNIAAIQYEPLDANVSYSGESIPLGPDATVTLPGVAEPLPLRSVIRSLLCQRQAFSRIWRKWIEKSAQERAESFKITLTFQPDKETFVLSASGESRQILELRSTVVVSVRSTPVKLDPRRFKGRNFGVAVLENIFSESPEASDPVVFSVTVDDEGVRASILVPPGSGSEGSQIHHLRMDAASEPTASRSEGTGPVTTGGAEDDVFELVAEAKRLLFSIPPDREFVRADPLDLPAVHLFSRARAFFLAVETLLEGGLTEEALVLARSLFDFSLRLAELRVSGMSVAASWILNSFADKKELAGNTDSNHCSRILEEEERFRTRLGERRIAPKQLGELPQLATELGREAESCVAWLGGKIRDGAFLTLPSRSRAVQHGDETAHLFFLRDEQRSVLGGVCAMLATKSALICLQEFLHVLKLPPSADLDTLLQRVRELEDHSQA